MLIRRSLFVAIALALLAQPGAGMRAATDEEYRPHRHAIPFAYRKEISVESDVFGWVEFTERRMNLMLRNNRPGRAGVDIDVLVTNAEGVTIWRHGDAWAFTTLEPEETYHDSVVFLPLMPSALQYSVHASKFDTEPRWIILRNEGKVVAPSR